MANYLYNGVELPDINEVWTDKETYPYAYLYTPKTGDTVHSLYLLSVPLTYDEDIQNLFTGDVAHSHLVYLHEVGKDNPWYLGWEREYDGNVLLASDNVIWSSVDILNKDGSVYLAASDPVPVGNAIIPLAHYKAACDFIRSKTGKNDKIRSSEWVAEAETAWASATGGASFNIHYGTEAPEDTSKLWVETDTKPTQTRVTNDISTEYSLDGVSYLPTVAGGIAAGVVGTKVYLFGGGSSGSYLSTINVYDTETNTITTLSTKLPTAAYGIAAGVVGTKIYLFGGGIENSPYYTKTINVFDTETNTITTLSTSLPQTTGFIAAGVVGTKIYLFGGVGSSLLSTINVFDTETNTITTLGTKLPTAASSIAAGVVGTKIYLFGGTGSSLLSTINVFDTETNTITTLGTSLSTTKGNVSVGVFGTKIYMFGGGGKATTYLSTINVYDTETNTITTLSTKLPTAAYGIAAGVVGTKIYLFGGYIDPTPYAQSNVSTFSIPLELAENSAVLLPVLGINTFPLISGDNTVELGVSAVYIGNADGQAEQVNAYLHNGTEWELI